MTGKMPSATSLEEDVFRFALLMFDVPQEGIAIVFDDRFHLW